MTFDLMYIVEIVLFGLAFAIGVVNLVMVLDIQKRNENMEKTYGLIGEQYDSILGQYKRLYDIHKGDMKIYDEILKSHEIVSEGYEVVAERMDGLATAYGEIKNQNKKVITAFGKAEKAYAQTEKDIVEYKEMLEKYLTPSPINEVTYVGEMLTCAETESEPNVPATIPAKKKTTRKKTKAEPEQVLENEA